MAVLCGHWVNNKLVVNYVQGRDEWEMDRTGLGAYEFMLGLKF